MKKFLFPILFVMIFSLTIADQHVDSIPVKQSIVDEDFFKQELQNSVLEFVNDLGLDPDSCYIPFKDEI